RQAIGRAVVARAIARLRHVARARRRAAHGARGLLPVGRAGRARAVAGLLRVARPRRRAAHRGGVARRVLAGIARAVAGVGRARIAVVGARRPARLLRIDGAARARARAGLRLIALARRRAAHGAGGLEGIGGTGIARPVAGLGLVANAGRRPAHGARRRLRIRRTGVGDPVAALRHIAGARRRATERRALRIGRTVDTRARASFGQVTRTRRRPTHGARVPRRVLARIAGAIALVEGAGVAVRAARGPGRSLRIGGAVDPGAR